MGATVKKTHRQCPKCGSRELIIFKAYFRIEIHDKSGKIENKINSVFSDLYPVIICKSCDYEESQYRGEIKNGQFKKIYSNIILRKRMEKM